MWYGPCMPDTIDIGTAAIVLVVALFTGPGLFALRFLVKRTKTKVDDQILEKIVSSGVPDLAKDRLRGRKKR